MKSFIYSIIILCVTQPCLASKRWNKAPKAKPATTLQPQALEKEKAECCSDDCVNKALCCTTASLLAMVATTYAVTCLYNAGYTQGLSEGYLEGNHNAHFNAYSNGYHDGVERMVSRHRIKEPSMDRMETDIHAGYRKVREEQQQNLLLFKNDE